MFEINRPGAGNVEDYDSYEDFLEAEEGNFFGRLADWFGDLFLSDGEEGDCEDD